MDDADVDELMHALGKATRKARRSVTMLQDALYAANKGKSDVVIDHLERVIADLETI